ncbi:GLEYA domain-containing protein [Trichoderma evansii]
MRFLQDTRLPIRIPMDTVTLAGTIPFRNADVATLQNWPILDFQPDVALNGQHANYSGLTQTLGIQRTCPPEHGKVYGTDVGTGIDYSIIQHIGYFRPKEAGTYRFQVDDGVRQTVYIWLGDRARGGWKNINANLIADASLNLTLNTWLPVVSEREVGQYIPIRILYVNAQGCGEFGITVLGPNNEVLVTRDQATTDGTFVSNCGASAEIPALSFDPVFDVDLGLSGNDLDLGIGANLGGLGISAGGHSLADTGSLGQDIGGNLAGLGVTLGSGSIPANQNGTLLNVTLGNGHGHGLNVTVAGDNGSGVHLNSSGLGVGVGGRNLTVPLNLTAPLNLTGPLRA